MNIKKHFAKSCTTMSKKRFCRHTCLSNFGNIRTSYISNRRYTPACYSVTFCQTLIETNEKRNEPLDFVCSLSSPIDCRRGEERTARPSAIRMCALHWIFGGTYITGFLVELVICRVRIVLPKNIILLHKNDSRKTNRACTDEKIWY